MISDQHKVSESDNKKWVPSVYTKLYRSIFDGSLYGQFEPLTTFMAMLALANQHGEVDASPERIAGSLGCKLEFVLRGVESLEAPDKRSRTPDEDGRRIIRLLNEDGQPRAFGWRIVNYAKYRAIRSEEERRAYKRQWDRDNRSRNPTNPTPPDRKRTQVEGEVEVDAKALKSKSPARSQFDTGEVIERIPMIGGEEFEVRESFTKELERLYPAVDIHATLKQMRGWCIGNPTKLKTPRGIRKFITGWCERDQNG